MKFYQNKVDQLFNAIKKKSITSLVIYGPDKGYIRKICASLVKEFNLYPLSHDFSEIKSKGLSTILNSLNFFNQRELIQISNIGTSIAPDIKTVLEGNMFHFPVFIGDELSPSSGWRKYFETAENKAIIACYNDDEQGIAREFLRRAKEENKIVKEDALHYLKYCLKGDHEQVTNEINKIFLYSHGKTTINIEDIQNIISPDIIANGDILCIYYAEKNYNKFLIEFDKIRKQNINEVLIIRALIRFNLNLYFVLTKIENGLPLDSAIKLLSPPIFFKYINDFKRILNQTNFIEINKTLELLQNCEINYKNNVNLYDLFTEITLSSTTLV